MTLSTTLFLILQQPEDIRSVNSTWLLAILVIGIFVIGLLGLAGWIEQWTGRQ